MIEERILDLLRSAEQYTIREWEGGTRREIRPTEEEARRIVQVIMELQQERHVAQEPSATDSRELEPVGPFGMDRY